MQGLATLALGRALASLARRTKRPSERKLRVGFALIAHGLDSLHHELEAVSSPLGARDRLLKVQEGLGIVEFLAEFFDEGMNLRVAEEKFAAEAGLQKQLFVQDI